MSIPQQSPFNPQCISCGREITSWYRWGVPSEIDCCFRCWRYVPVAERLKIMISLRDRQPGGFMAELAELVLRSIDQQSKDFE